MLVMNTMLVFLSACREDKEINDRLGQVVNEDQQALDKAADVAPALTETVLTPPVIATPPAPDIAFEEGGGGYFNKLENQPARTGNDDGELCGNGEIDGDEECDDGNAENGTYCSRACRISIDGCTIHLGQDTRYILCTGDESWNTAQNICQGFGPFNLATINDSQENTFINTILDGNAWIGFNDINQENTFTWISGQPVTFVSWNSGEPNNDGNQDCTQYISQTTVWDDLYCTSELDFLCELDPPDTDSLGNPLADEPPLPEDAPLGEIPTSEEEVPSDPLVEQPEEEIDHPTPLPPEVEEPPVDDLPPSTAEELPAE